MHLRRIPTLFDTKFKEYNNLTFYEGVLMSEAISQLDMIIPLFEASIPQIVTPNQLREGLNRLAQGADLLSDDSLSGYDNSISRLATTLKILISGESPFLGTVTFQGFVLEILEELNKLQSNLQSSSGGDYNFQRLQITADFFLRLAERMMIRYKVGIEFEPEYEAKSLRAFMVLKELKKSSRFLVVSPDLAENQNANLDNGLEVEILSQTDPKKLHEMVSEVLEVKSVQIFEERKNMTVHHLDPPTVQGSVDSKYTDYLE